MDQHEPAAVRGRAGALLVVGDPIFHTPPKHVPDLAAQARLPSLFIIRDAMLAGGSMSYGPDFVDMLRRGARLS